MAYVIAALVGLLFGGADQQLGTHGVWGATAAQVSAPWLILPFVIGLTQRSARKAAVLGLVATAAGLFGYFGTTYSPLEIHPWTLQRFTHGFLAVTTSGYNPLYVVGGMVTGPVFGFLGQRWRIERSWVSAALVAGALCLEPLARSATGHLYPPVHVWTIEVVLGAVVAVAFSAVVLTSKHAKASVPSS